MSQFRESLLTYDRCDGCDLNVARGAAGCQTIFDEMVARDFSDVGYFRFHRMLVDTYCLQHPHRYCVTANSFASHLIGLAWAIENGGTRAALPDALRRWLEGKDDLIRPKVPSCRGEMTIADVRAAMGRFEHGEAVERWANETWAAYAGLHDLARSWISRALAVRWEASSHDDALRAAQQRFVERVRLESRDVLDDRKVRALS